MLMKNEASLMEITTKKISSAELEGIYGVLNYSPDVTPSNNLQKCLLGDRVMFEEIQITAPKDVFSDKEKITDIASKWVSRNLAHQSMKFTLTKFNAYVASDSPLSFEQAQQLSKMLAPYPSETLTDSRLHELIIKVGELVKVGGIFKNLCNKEEPNTKRFFSNLISMFRAEEKCNEVLKNENASILILS